MSRIFWRRFFRHRLAVAGALLVAFFLGIAVMAPHLFTHDPDQVVVSDRLQPPSPEHHFGTDDYGRDVYSRVIDGTRLSLKVGFYTVVWSTLVGAVIGVLAGYYGGWVDSVTMRLMDAVMAFPALLLALAIMAFLGPGLRNLVIALVIVNLPVFSRVARASTLALKGREFVEAAHALGQTDGRIMWKHILPNALSPLIVQATLSVAYAILTESALSFLGVGVPQPNPSWGNILSDGRKFIREAPWISVFPGIAIAGLVLGINLLGDGLRDLLDPRLRGKSKGA